MKLYEARTNAGLLMLRHNYIKHNMLPVGFAESHMRYYRLDGGQVHKSTYRFWIR